MFTSVRQNESHISTYAWSAAESVTLKHRPSPLATMTKDVSKLSDRRGS